MTRTLNALSPPLVLVMWAVIAVFLEALGE